MKIAVIGIRGVPVAYSTFETFAQTLGAELVKKDHEFTVYCRNAYVTKGDTFCGMNRIVLPSIETKQLGTFTHSLLATMHAVFFSKYDVILYLGVANAIYSLWPRLFGVKTLIHIDGLDWERIKWGVLAKAYLRFSLYLTTLFPNVVISDNEVIVKYYRKKYKKGIENIAYGYYPQNMSQSKLLLKKYNIEPGKYIIWVGRLVPDNNIEELIDAFELVRKKVKLVIIGDDYYNHSYKKELLKIFEKDERIIKTGFINHEDVLTLIANAKLYVETKRNGGTQMSLIETMGTGVIIIANDSIAHKNVLGNTAIYYDPKKGKKVLSEMLNTYYSYSDKKAAVFGNKAKKRAEKYYQWKDVIAQYEKLFSRTMYAYKQGENN